MVDRTDIIYFFRNYICNHLLYIALTLVKEAPDQVTGRGV